VEPWKRVTTADPVIEELQDNAEPLMRLVEGSELLDGVLIKNQTLLVATPTDINHGLQRAPVGFFVTRKRANAVVWDLQDDNPSKTSTIRLIASAEVTLDVWVF
jgi:hypothetical protein